MKMPIKGFEGIYEIYDNGDVVNIQRKKILSGSIGEGGYKYYRLSSNGQKKMKYAHRLVAEHFLKNPDNLPVVNHKDGNKLNNAVNNLEWVSYSDNAVHAHSTGLIKERQKAEYYENDLPEEEWTLVSGFEYAVSTKGRVRNENTYRLLKPSITCGYYKVRLSKDGHVEDKMIHNLVYDSFIGDRITDGHHVIDHIDGNKLNNSIDNLRQITLSENVNAALYESKTNSNCKKVKQFDLKHNFIAEYPSAREAARQLNLDSSTISKVCRGQNKTHGGFIFEYV